MDTVLMPNLNQMEKRRSMKPLQQDNVKDLLMSWITAVTLQNQGSVVTLSPYYRWIAKRYKSETLKVLKDWILDKTE